MKKLTTFFLVTFFLTTFLSAQHAANNSSANVKNHPEQGILPFNAPCSDCVELLEKRTLNHREFVGKSDGTGERSMFVQQSYGNMHYLDENGYLITKDPHLKKESEFVYAARQQPSPVVIDFKNKWASIKNGDKELKFNKNISLELISLTGEIQNFGEGNWSKVVITDDPAETTLTIEDFYPGINLVMRAGSGKLKTSFVITQRLQINQRYAGGWLAMTQQLDVPSGLTTDLSASIENAEHRHLGKINFLDEKNNNAFYFTPGMAYDAHENSENFFEMPFTLENNKVDYYVPVNWLNSKSTLYPVTVDPSVFSGDTLLQASIINSGYTSVCGTQGCSYFMNNVIAPANGKIYKIYNYFAYLAMLPCTRSDGSFDITMTNSSSGNSCNSGNQYCIGSTQGSCFFWPQQLYYYAGGGNGVFGPCLNAPQCSSYPLDFELKFRRCNWVPVPVCDPNCIQSFSDWIINIESRTVDLSVLGSQPICAGSCTDLGAVSTFGVPPYSYTWDGTFNGQIYHVCPPTTTNYLCTVTDACGESVTDTTTVTVSPFQNPGFTIGPNDSVCIGTQITFTANSNDPDSLFEWYIECATTDTITDTKVVNYVATAPGPCTVTLLYDGAPNGCNLLEEDFYVLASTTPSVSITGPSTVCSGDSVIFSAVIVNGGSSPTYQWYVNGNLFSTNDVITSANFSNGDFIELEIQSSELCASPLIASDSMMIAVLSSVIPAVTIFASEDTVCIGDQVLFTAISSGGGTNPSYQWTLNGVNIAGATNSTYMLSMNGGDVVAVILTSNALCVDPDVATDSAEIVVENCSGIKEQSQSFFSLHPNPATDVLNIEFHSPSRNSKSVFVIDALGRTLIEFQNIKDTKLKVDLSNLARATYFVKVVEGEREYLEKLVVQ